MKMPSFKMPQFKMPEWAVNAGWVMAIIGVVIGIVVMVVTLVAAAFAWVTINLFLGALMRAGVLWLAWTYSGFGLMFTNLPAHLQQIEFLPIFCGAVIWQVLVYCIRAPFKMNRRKIVRMAKAPKFPDFPRMKGAQRA